ncbi:EamA family transporter [Patescibacteria group bacterium]
MNWLLITIGAYLLFALANVGDKVMVSKYKTEPVVYAFYVGFLGIVTLVLIPFGVIWPSAVQLFWSFFGGVSFVFALFFMYKAINAGETTKAITIMGGSSPIFTFLFSYLFLAERLSQWQIGAFLILIIAIIIISWDLSAKKQKVNKTQVFYAVIAGIVFAASYVLAKYVYLHQPFVSGFVWLRIGGFITALLLVLVPANRKLIKIDWQRPKQQKGALLFAIQVVGGLGVIGQNYAFKIASATLVNALQAVQYALVFVFASLFGMKIPVLKESFSTKQIVQKIIAIILIGCGLYLLALK